MTTHGRPRLLITGASGFVGRHAVAALSERYELVALTGRRSLPPHLAARCAQVMTGDIDDADGWPVLDSGIDAVCHLAARVPTDHEDPAQAEACLRTNALATLRLGRESLRVGARRFVYLSAGTAYRASRELATEGDSVYPTARATYYLGSKVMGELYLEHLRVVAGLPAVSLRASAIYGPGMRASSVVGRYVAQALKNLPLHVHHGGTPAADLVYVSDVVSCLQAALEHGEPGTYNVGAGRAWTLLDLAERVVERFSSASSIVVEQPEGPIPASFPPLATDKARRAWGYSPLTLDQGLDRWRLAESVA